MELQQPPEDDASQEKVVTEGEIDEDRTAKPPDAAKPPQAADGDGTTQANETLKTEDQTSMESADTTPKKKLKDLAAEAKGNEPESVESKATKEESDEVKESVDSKDDKVDAAEVKTDMAESESSEVKISADIVGDEKEIDEEIAGDKQETITDESEEVAFKTVINVTEDVTKDTGSVEDVGEVTAEDVKADLIKKQALMLQEDTTDSEVRLITSLI